jgi:hypothetical protein
VVLHVRHSLGPRRPNALLAKALKVQQLSSTFYRKLCSLQGPRSSANIAFAPSYFSIGRTAALGEVLHALPGPIFIAHCDDTRLSSRLSKLMTGPLWRLTLSGQGRRGLGQRLRRPQTRRTTHQAQTEKPPPERRSLRRTAHAPSSLRPLRSWRNSKGSSRPRKTIRAARISVGQSMSTTRGCA